VTPRPTGGAGGEPGRLERFLFRIRTRLLLANLFLVVAPIAGLSFARTFERELLRSEEEGMVVLAMALSAGLGSAAEGQRLSVPAELAEAARAAAARLGAQVRVLDAAGRGLSDTGPEAIEKVTQGRTLIGRSASTVVVRDEPPPAGTFADRPEVKKALSGGSGRYTRVASQVRSVRLFVAEPVRARGGAVVGVVYVSRTTYPVLVALYRIRNGLVRVVGVSLAAGAVVAIFLALTISRPLHKLTRAARRIAAGERGVALNLSGRDEVADLSRAFDTMARELDARLLYISELAANVSHEFKTPISSIRGAAELLRDGAADEPAARDRFLGNILDDTERLSRLVTRLLELSRIEAGHDAGVPFDYRAMCEEVAGRQAGEGRAVTLDYRARHALLRGTPEQLESVLQNLLDNAARFSPAGGAITVTVEHGPDDAIVTRVVDRGVGISEANLPQVWGRFFTTARERGGTGLGLSIVRAIVEAHGGEVGASSTPGVGSTFWFSLPRRL
jgi:two-component system, OmpR family, sensor histidine kinase ChvG